MDFKHRYCFTHNSYKGKKIRLKKKYSLTTVVIAHTPKRRGYEPITQNDLAGSAKLISFFDAGIAIARSAKDNNITLEDNADTVRLPFKEEED